MKENHQNPNLAVKPKSKYKFLILHIGFIIPVQFSISNTDIERAKFLSNQVLKAALFYSFLGSQTKQASKGIEWTSRMQTLKQYVNTEMLNTCDTNIIL